MAEGLCDPEVGTEEWQWTEHAQPACHESQRTLAAAEKEAAEVGVATTVSHQEAPPFSARAFGAKCAPPAGAPPAAQNPDPL